MGRLVEVRGGRVQLRPGDLERFELIVASFPHPEPWEPGRWLREAPGRLWLELVTQLLVVGGRRPVEAMWGNGELLLLSLDRVLVAASESPEHAQRTVHELLARNGVRYAGSSASVPSVKAVQVVDAALSPVLVRGGVFRLRELLLPLLPGPPEWGAEARGREREARLLLIRHVRGFGMKSAGDFLNHLGASQNLIAFDSRIQTLLTAGFGLPAEELRRLVSRPAPYEELERPFVEEVCPRLGMSPALLDELLFANSDAARRLLVGR